MTTATAENNVCARIAQRLASVVGTQRYRMWFDRSAKLEYLNQHQRLDVTVPNRFVADWINRHFIEDLRRAARDELGAMIGLELRIRPDRFAPGVAAGTGGPHTTGTPPCRSAGQAQPQTISRGRAGTTDPPASSRHNARPAPRELLRHSLDSFVVGPSNELAYTAASRVMGDDHASVNPLFLHGGCGVGKTHLLQGICSKMLHTQPNARVLYITAEQFTNDFLTAMRSNKLDPFRKRIRRLDLLAIDDVHFLANKQATQQEFLHSFDAIELGGARVVLASDSHPKLIKQFSESLISRFLRGMVVQMQLPDLQTRAKIIRALVQRRGICVLDSAIEELARRCAGSVREIEGALTKIYALAHLVGTRRPIRVGSDPAGPAAPSDDPDPPAPIGCALVHRLFDDDAKTRPLRKAVSFEELLGTVVTQLGVSRVQILGPGRHRHVVLARSLLIYLARQLTSMSYPEIASAMGRRTHSTMVNATRRVEQWLSEQDLWTLPVSGERVSLADLIARIKHHVMRASC